MEVNEFKKICILLDSNFIVQKYIIDGPTYFFDDIFIGDEFEFKKEIANILKVHIRDIVIVGSGKLGFSLKPDHDVPETGLYKFKKFDHDFELDNNLNKSDLDIAIVSSRLFDIELENLYNHTDSYKYFIGKNRTDFAKYILKGRFKIDYLPIDFPLTNELSLAQSNFKSIYGRNVNIEIYKSWHFFEKYHINNLLSIKLNLIA